MDATAIKHFLPSTSGTGGSNIAQVYVTFLGQTLGGDSVTSNVFQFPVNVCYGCLVSYPPAAPAGYCKGGVASESTAAASLIGQDQVSDCQLCSDVPFCASLH
jgi:hypothetical protein